MSPIVLFGGEKGGTGKTMLTTNLACCFRARGLVVRVIDADQQGSTARWASKRDLGSDGGVPEGVALKRISWGILQHNIADALRDEAERCDIVLVDVGGSDTTEFHTGMDAATALYSPVIPSDCDIATIAPVDRLAGLEQGTRALVAKVILNHVSNHVSDEEQEEARVFLSECKHLVCADRVVHTRKPFRQAFRMRMAVTECAELLPDRRQRAGFQKAAEEVWAIFEMVCADLGLKV